jgi:hypothetical protein
MDQQRPQITIAPLADTQQRLLTTGGVLPWCWRRLKIDHPYRLKIDQGKLLYSVLYSIEIVDQTELVLNPFFY